MKRVLIVGSGDIALRVAALFRNRCKLFGLVRNPARAGILREAGIVPVRGDLDNMKSLRRIAGLADVVLHFAPTQQHGTQDLRPRHLLAALSQGTLPKHLIYISTTGVYGDCRSDWVSETHVLRPQTARAQRRVDAERQLRAWIVRKPVRTSILRVPGIYAADRLPLERIRAAIPSIVHEEDGHTNHIHADDLAHIVLAALRYGKPSRAYNTCDDSQMMTGDYFDAVADAFCLPRPLRLTKEQVKQVVSPAIWSYLNESRRLSNERMKKELKIRLRHPEVKEALKDL